MEINRRYLKNKRTEKISKSKSAFTLIELIVVMAIIGVLVLLAVPKFIGYTERARETKHIHTAKVIETALEAHLINGGAFPDDLEVVDITLLEEAANKETLIGVNGYVSTVDEEVYYELTYDFIKKLDVKLSAKNALLIEANASSVPTAVYASEKGIALVDKEKTMKGYELKPGEIPIEVNSNNIIQVSSGHSHTLALKEDGTVLAWGYNYNGQIGDGTREYRYSPVSIPIPEKIIQVSAGKFYSLALTRDGEVYSWGQNYQGELGNGTNVESAVPSKIKNLTNVIQLDTEDAHSLALLNDGTVKSWGLNNVGQLGRNSAFDANKPMPISNLNDVVQVSVGHNYSMALLSDGTVKAWGSNGGGVLGDGTTVNKYAPVQVLNLSSVKKIEIGGYITMAILEDGTVKGWGSNQFGLIQNKKLSTSVSSPITVSGITSPEKIVLNNYNAIALMSDGTIKSWGLSHYGVLGNNNSVDTHIPTTINGLENMLNLSMGEGFSIAVTKDGHLWSWGKNNLGQLGDGTSENKPTPTLITLP